MFCPLGLRQISARRPLASCHKRVLLSETALNFLTDGTNVGRLPGDLDKLLFSADSARRLCIARLRRPAHRLHYGHRTRPARIDAYGLSEDSGQPLPHAARTALARHLAENPVEPGVLPLVWLRDGGLGSMRHAPRQGIDQHAAER